MADREKCEASDPVGGLFFLRHIFSQCSFFLSIMTSPREFFCRIPASLVKDPKLAPEAKLLYLVLAAHADGHTGKTYLGLRTIERLMGCSRWKRERAQRLLAQAGWLRLKRKRCSQGRWGKRVFLLSLFDPRTSAQFHHSGENEPFIFDHSQVGPSSAEVPRGFSSSVATISD